MTCVEIKKFSRDRVDLHAIDATLISTQVGAYVNPLPALGVALEIRPLLLRASTAKERVDAAVAGIASSIAHLDGTRRLW